MKSHRKPMNDQNDGQTGLSTTTPTMGLDALCHSEPDILPNTPLHFQWMRPHPDLFLSDEEDCTRPQLDFKPGDVEIDLADLIFQTAPPLMINWVPKLDASVEYMHHNDRSTNALIQEGANNGGDDEGEVNAKNAASTAEPQNEGGLWTCKSLVEEATRMLNLLRSEQKNYSGVACNDVHDYTSQIQMSQSSHMRNSTRNKTSPFNTVVDHKLLLLPLSHDLAVAIENAVMINGKEKEGKIGEIRFQRLNLLLMSFIILAQQQSILSHQQQRLLGRHILCILVPSLLAKFATGVDMNEPSVSNIIQQRLRHVAHTIVLKCGGRDAVQQFYSESFNEDYPMIMKGDGDDEVKEKCILLNELW
eukprot:CAMPEP_0116042620 /NCGR_PEP_ID=MMETSP0321-20121206/25811_1 /TAXON_ID=163516 /ORGANISM="Leptocylindrus danicus var. danicus, Strain B650" /LENGTH=360 /DNA_ID=CAMNT_0003523157 /DNA_START=124 /DNA_END=1203 /DNA_ORIENTATION=+